MAITPPGALACRPEDAPPYPTRSVGAARLVVEHLHPGWLSRLESRFGPIERSSFASRAVIEHADELLRRVAA